MAKKKKKKKPTKKQIAELADKIFLSGASCTDV
jgi:hypothetical protein